MENIIVCIALKIPLGEDGRIGPVKICGKEIYPSEINPTYGEPGLDTEFAKKYSLYNVIMNCTKLWTDLPSLTVSGKNIEFGKPKNSKSYHYVSGQTKKNIDESSTEFTWIGLNFATFAELRNWLTSNNGTLLFSMATEAHISELLTFTDF
jgi:hypothetical protein